MAMGVEEQADTYAKEVKGRVDLKDGGHTGRRACDSQPLGGTYVQQ